MQSSTQKVGISLGFPVVPPDSARFLVARALGGGEGVIEAVFSMEMPDIVEVEYDPRVTTPYRIYRATRHLLDHVGQGIAWGASGLALTSDIYVYGGVQCKW